MNPSQKHPPLHRLLWALAGAAVLAPAALAARLDPDQRGFGTHEQLGWAPCVVRTVWGRPCPTCGMTTAWAHLARGEVRAAAAANTAGVLLAAAAVGASAWLIGSALIGQLIGGLRSPRWFMAFATAWLAAAVLDWARRLAMG